MDKNLETVVLRHLIRSENYARQVLPFLKGKYFSQEHRNVFNTVCNYVAKYNTFPTSDALKIEIEQERPSGMDGSLVLLHEIFEGEVHSDQNWLTDQTEKWCQTQAIGQALMESIEIFQGNVKDKDTGAIPDILQSALAISFDNSVGLNYTEDAERRFKAYHNRANKVGFDLEMMNKITKGGFETKSLNVFMAGPGVGKSLMMCHMAASALARGKNVLYITNEMAEEKIGIRLDANLFDIPIDDVERMDRNEFMSRANKIVAKTHGRLFVKEYPTGSANVNHYRALVDELALKQKFKADIIFVDYLNIMASSRLRSIGGAVNSYSLVKSIAEEVRGFGVEQAVPIVTATQVNREGWGNSDVDLDNVSESFGLPATADFMMAIIQNEEHALQGKLICKQLKNRYADMNLLRTFALGVDKSRMKLFDAEDFDDDIPVMDKGAVSDSTESYSQFKF